MRLLLAAALVFLAYQPLWAQTASFQILGKDSGINVPLKTEIFTREDWTALWVRHAAGRNLPVPAVDFTKSSVVAEFGGGAGAPFSMRAKPVATLPQAATPGGYGKALTRSSDKVKVLLRVNNDAIFTPQGILAFAVDPHVADIDAKGMDVGYTHGTELEVSKTDSRGRTYRLHAGTNLYALPTGEPITRGKDGHPIIPINFTEENIFSASADNLDGPDGLKWKGGAGIRILNSDHVTSAGATKQQVVFHKTMDAKGMQPEYVYRPDGRGVRTAPFVEGAVGYTHTLSTKGSRTVRTQSYVEPQIFPTTDASNVKVHSELSLRIRRKKSLIKAVVGADAIAHKDGVALLPAVTLAYERRKWGVETMAAFPVGSLQNSVNYNWDRAPYNSLGIYALIGRDKKK